MKTLFILRHASAIPGGYGHDIERNLDDVGIREATSLKQQLKKNNIQPHVALVSPANRTRQTFEYVFSNENGGYITSLNIVPKFYNAHFLTLLEQIQQTDDNIQSLVVVAHNPGVSQLASFICRQSEGFQLPTAGMLQLGFKSKHWRDLGEGNCTLIKKWY